jgi:N-carbamoylputrescine amidase
MDREEIVLAEIDPAEVEEKRVHWPFLRDRRIDAYGEILQRFLK